MSVDSTSQYTLLSPSVGSNEYECCKQFELWCFHNSSIGIFREYSQNTWCKYLDCCSTCLEVKCNNVCSQFLVEIGKNTNKDYVNDDCLILCCCVSFILL